MNPTDLETIRGFLSTHHGYQDPDIDMERFAATLPKIMDKITGKVENYCELIEARFRSISP